MSELKIFRLNNARPAWFKGLPSTLDVEAKSMSQAIDLLQVKIDELKVVETFSEIAGNKPKDRPLNLRLYAEQCIVRLKEFFGYESVEEMYAGLKGRDCALWIESLGYTKPSQAIVDLASKLFIDFYMGQYEYVDENLVMSEITRILRKATESKEVKAAKAAFQAGIDIDDQICQESLAWYEYIDTVTFPIGKILSAINNSMLTDTLVDALFRHFETLLVNDETMEDCIFRYMSDLIREPESEVN